MRPSRNETNMTARIPFSEGHVRLLFRVHWIVEMIAVERPCAVGVCIPDLQVAVYLPKHLESRAMPTETNVESETFESNSGTFVDSRNSGDLKGTHRISTAISFSSGSAFRNMVLWCVGAESLFSLRHRTVHSSRPEGAQNEGTVTHGSFSEHFWIYVRP